MGGGHPRLLWLSEVRGADGPVDGGVQPRGPPRLAGRGHRQRGEPDHGESSTESVQARQGCTLVVGSMGDRLCPVAAVLGFMAVAGRRQGPLFQYASGKPLTQAGFVVEVKAALERGGVCSDGFSGHSFRIGAATAAAEAGVGDAVIQLLGRWKSDAYKGYVQPERVRLAGIPRQMAKRGAGEAAVMKGPPRKQGREAD